MKHEPVHDWRHWVVLVTLSPIAALIGFGLAKIIAWSTMVLLTHPLPPLPF